MSRGLFQLGKGLTQVLTVSPDPGASELPHTLPSFITPGPLISPIRPACGSYA